MCESKVLEEVHGELKLIVDEVIYIRKSGDSIEVVKISGEREILKNYDIKYIDFLSSKIVVVKT